jgi:hypothetical protein
MLKREEFHNQINPLTNLKEIYPKFGIYCPILGNLLYKNIIGLMTRASLDMRYIPNGFCVFVEKTPTLKYLNSSRI